MNIAQILLSLLAEAPNLIADGEAAAKAFAGSADVAGKAEAVVAGIDHIVANVLPHLK